MPVTLSTANHCRNSWREGKASTTEELFKHSCPSDHQACQKSIRHSFSKGLLDESHISASQNGFVWAVFYAYSNHYHLTIRPEDVWFSILTQLSLFINAHAEELRSYFVTHKGKKNLTVVSNDTFSTADFGDLSVQMTDLIQEKVVDPELRSWIMPEFTTTTKTDEAIAAILMMGALKKYFSYTMSLRCGITSVTLLGEQEDWMTIVTKLDKLKQLGDEPARFAQLLRPVLNSFVACFDDPSSDKVQAARVQAFWSRCAHKEAMGSGPMYLSGWLTVFCFWGDDGNLLFQEPILSKSSVEFERKNSKMSLFDALSRRVDIGDIPPGSASVPVIVEEPNGRIHRTTMVAGLIGIEATSSQKDTDPSDDTKGHVLDSIQPFSGWWMYEFKSKKKKKYGRPHASKGLQPTRSAADLDWRRRGPS